MKVCREFRRRQVKWVKINCTVHTLIVQYNSNSFRGKIHRNIFPLSQNWIADHKASGQHAASVPQTTTPVLDTLTRTKDIGEDFWSGHLRVASSLYTRQLWWLLNIGTVEDWNYRIPSKSIVTAEGYGRQLTLMKTIETMEEYFECLIIMTLGVLLLGVSRWCRSRHSLS